jgi:hypothetical protein
LRWLRVGQKTIRELVCKNLRFIEHAKQGRRLWPQKPSNDEMLILDDFIEMVDRHPSRQPSECKKNVRLREKRLRCNLNKEPASLVLLHDPARHRRCALEEYAENKHSNIEDQKGTMGSHLPIRRQRCSTIFVCDCRETPKPLQI